ncbi:MAG: NUDIX hydrolase [Geminicoccaceae bacterium]|nr:NUDIX hydrolase [Geminicoccaceae bacterium]
MSGLLGEWVDHFFRLAYRLGYPLARRWWRWTGGRAQGAAVALRVNGALLVVRESYRDGLGLPAGGRAAGESAREAAVRELAEEVGVRLRVEQLTLVRERTFRWHGRQITDSLFEAVLDERPAVAVDRREIIWAGWMALADIPSSDAQPTLRFYLSERRSPRADRNEAPVLTGR